jgi:hypothetical protein
MSVVSLVGRLAGPLWFGQQGNGWWVGCLLGRINDPLFGRHGTGWWVSCIT